MSRKYILQESLDGNLTILGTNASVVTDGEDVAVKSDNEKLICFREYEPVFEETDFENCYLEKKQMLMHNKRDDEIVESLKGKEFEAVSVCVCEVNDNDIIVSYQGQKYKINSDELYFEESDNRRDMEEYRELLGHNIQMFPHVNSGRLTFSETRIRYTEDKSKSLPRDTKVGDEVKGVPVGYRIGLGIFVLLECSRSSLLHISDLTGIMWKQVRKDFPLGQTMTFRLKNEEQDRIFVEPVNPQKILPSISLKSTWEEIIKNTQEGVSEEIKEGQIVDIVIKYVEKEDNGFKCYVICGRHRGILIQKYASHDLWQHTFFVAKRETLLPAVAHINNGAYEFCVEEAGLRTLNNYEENQRTKCMKRMKVLGSNPRKILLRFENSIGILNVENQKMVNSVVTGGYMDVFLHYISDDGCLVLNEQEEQDDRSALLDKVRAVDGNLTDGNNVEVTILGVHGNDPVFTISGFVGTFAKSELDAMKVKLQKGDVVRVAFTGQFQLNNNRLLFHFVELVSRIKTEEELSCLDDIQRPTMDTPCKGALCQGVIKKYAPEEIVVNVYKQDYVLGWQSLRLCDTIVAIDGILQVLFPPSHQVQLIVTDMDDITGQPSFKLYYPEERLLDIYEIVYVTEDWSVVRGEQGVGIIERKEYHSKDKRIFLARTGYDENWMPILSDETSSYLQGLIGTTVSGSILNVQPSGVSIASLFPYHEMGHKIWMPCQEWYPNEDYPRDYLGYQGVPITANIIDIDEESKTLIVSQKTHIENKATIPSNSSNMQISRPAIGEIVEATVVDVSDDNSLRLDGYGWMGIVGPSDIIWGYLKMGTCAYKKGDRIRCRVVEWQEETGIMICSIKAILPQPEEEAEKDSVYMFTVHGMDNDNIFLTSPNGFPAILPRKEDETDTPLSFSNGIKIPAMVQRIDYERQVLVLTRKPLINLVVCGKRYNCVVESVSSSSLVLEYKGLHSTLGMADVANTSLNLLGMYKKGDNAEAMVISYDWQLGTIKLSIKSAEMSRVLRKSQMTIGNKIQAKVLIVESDKLIVQWKEKYGCISKKDAVTQDTFLLEEIYKKGQVVDCVITSVKEGKENYFTATTNPDFVGIIKAADVREGENYKVTIIRQEKDRLIVGYGDVRGSIPNSNLYWGVPFVFDNEKYQVGKELSAVCHKIIPQQCNVLFHYDKGENEAEHTHVVSVEQDSVIINYQGTSYKLDNGNCPIWFFSEDDDIEVKPVRHKNTYLIRIQKDNTLLPEMGDKVTVEVHHKKADGLVVLLPSGIKGFIPKEELGWISAECDIDNYNTLQMIRDVVVESIDDMTGVPCLSRRATIEDPMADFKLGMKVNMSITKVSESLVIGMSGTKNAIIEKRNAGWKFQFAFSEDLTTTFKVGDQLEAIVLGIDRDNEILSLGLDTCKPSDEELTKGKSYDVEIVTGKPDGLDRLGECYLVKWDNCYGFMPYSQADSQPMAPELYFRSGEKVRACIYDYDAETRIPFMFHRSDENLELKVGDVFKAVVLDSSDLGILIKLKDYDFRSFIELRQLYYTLQDMYDRPYLKDEEIDVEVRYSIDKKVYFKRYGMIECPVPVGERACKVTVLSKASNGYNVYTDDGFLAWLPAKETDFISYVCKIYNTDEQKINAGQYLHGVFSFEKKRKYATFKVAGVDVSIARSISNVDVTDWDDICLETNGIRLRGCIFQGNSLPIYVKQKLKEQLNSEFHTNFGRITIPDGVKMRVKYQKKTPDGTILVSIIQLLGYK